MSRIAEAELDSWVRHLPKSYLEQIVMAMAAKYLRDSASAHDIAPDAVEIIKATLGRWRQTRSRRKPLTAERAVEYLLGIERNQPELPFWIQ